MVVLKKVDFGRWETWCFHLLFKGVNTGMCILPISLSMGWIWKNQYDFV